MDELPGMLSVTSMFVYLSTKGTWGTLNIACSAGVFHGRALNNKFSSRISLLSPSPLLYFSASRPLP